MPSPARPCLDVRAAIAGGVTGLVLAVPLTAVTRIHLEGLVSHARLEPAPFLRPSLNPSG